jgi:hypothetical protein
MGRDQSDTNASMILTQIPMFKYDVPHIKVQLFAILNSELYHIFLVAHTGSIHTSAVSEIFYSYILM